VSDKVQANWYVDALHEPGTLSRILEFFVLRGIELAHVVASQEGADRQVVHLSSAETSTDEATVIAAKIGQIATVRSVSLSLESANDPNAPEYLVTKVAG
jgi:acetolactate synthase regulatory subunit